MPRAHLYRPILDPEGNLLSGLVVRVLEPGTTQPITETIYSTDEAGGAQTLGNPHTAGTGIVSIYLAEPKRVRLGVKQGSGIEVFYEDLDVALPGGGGSKITVGNGLPLTAGRKAGDEHFDNTDPAKLKQYVLTGNPLDWFELKGSGFRSGAGTGSIIGGDLNSPATAAGQTGIAIGSGAAANGTNSIAIGQVDAADHDLGPVADSDAVAIGGSANAGGSSVAIGNVAVAGSSDVALGQNTTANGGSSVAIGQNATSHGGSATAVGQQAAADSGSDSAYGQQAHASGGSSTAVGQQAASSGASSTAVGQQAVSSGGSSTAVGQQAVASNDSASAFGQQATASNLSATALGASSYVSDAGGTAVGNSAAAIGPDAVAIGHNALTGRSNLPPTDPANDQNLAIGNTTEARGGQSTAVGSQAQANFAHTTSLGWGSYSSVDGTALGHQATAGPRGVALGKDASAANDQGLIKVNELEVQPSGPGSTDSTLALHGGTGGAKHAIGVNDKGLTFDGQPYPPVPAPVADPETGETTTVASVFSVQTIVSGDLVVAPNIVKPGLRVVQTSTAHTIVARVDTVPTGASIVIVVERWNGGTYANDIGTVTIAAGTSLGVVTGLAVACAKGDIVKFRCTQIGSTVAGADINLSVDFK